MATEIDWADYAPAEHHAIIKHGTTHGLFAKAATQVLVQAVKAETRTPLSPLAARQLEEWISSAIAKIDERYFDTRLKRKEEHIDDHLNGIAVSALAKFG